MVWTIGLIWPKCPNDRAGICKLAKNHFGELLGDVAALGSVEIVKHGRVVAIVLSPRVSTGASGQDGQGTRSSWTRTHMIPPALARAARIVGRGVDFDDDWA